MSKSRIAIFASGSGSNAERISHHFKDHPKVEIALIASNNPDAFVLERARKLNIPHLVFSKKEFLDQDYFLHQMEKEKIDFIVLAGFLLLVPSYLIQAFPDKIINIHPALLPSYGGKGMYGMNVHKAVIENKEKESGISIHLVNERYDEGAIIAQFKCEIAEGHGPEELAESIHQLEYNHFPQVIEQWINESQS